MNTDKIYAESIASEYAPKETSKVVALRKLDRKAKLPATILAYTLGIVGALVFGLGLCLAMQVIGAPTVFTMILGIVIGVVGLVLVVVNYPLYQKLLTAGRQKYAYDIIRLAREITEG